MEGMGVKIFKYGMVIVAFLAVLQSVVHASVVADLARMRTTYTNEVGKIEKECAASITSWGEQYSAALRNLEQSYQKAGQLEPLIAVKKELKRFVDDKTIDELSITNTFPELYRVQKTFAATGKALPANRESRLTQLKQLYDRNLQTLQENLTRQGDLDGALTVKNTRDMLQRPPEETLDVDGNPIDPGDAGAGSTPAATVSGTEDPRAGVVGGKTLTEGNWTQAEARIMERYGELVSKLQQQDDTVATLVEPAYVTEHGAKATRLKLRFLFSYLVTADASIKTQASVKGSLADRRATLVPFVMTDSGRKEFAAVNWVSVGGEWYISIGTAAGR